MIPRRRTPVQRPCAPCFSFPCRPDTGSGKVLPGRSHPLRLHMIRTCALWNMRGRPGSGVRSVRIPQICFPAETIRFRPDSESYTACRIRTPETDVCGRQFRQKSVCVPPAVRVRSRFPQRKRCLPQASLSFFVPRAENPLSKVVVSVSWR